MASMGPPFPKPVHDDLYEENSTAWMVSTQEKLLSETETLCQRLVNCTQAALNWVGQYVDVDYMLWIKWLLSPIILTFVILPLVLLLLIYVSSLTLYIYRAHRKRLIRKVASYVEQGEISTDLFWAAGREAVATLWDAHAWLWHGYELRGLEHLPATGGALLVYYHGAMPVDYYYLVNRIFLTKEVMVHSVVDKFLFKMPGFKLVLEVFCCTPGTVDTCAEQLKAGKVLGVSPGGVYEAQFGDHNYKILWKNRLGFARAALQAEVPVIPVFTENIRESFRVLPFGQRFFQWLFTKTRLPLRPLFGGFPVKLVTHLGEPIYPTQNMTPEDLRDLCKEALEALILEHQRLPGSIFRGILDRFWTKPMVHRD